MREKKLPTANHHLPTTEPPARLRIRERIPAPAAQAKEEASAFSAPAALFERHPVNGRSSANGLSHAAVVQTKLSVNAPGDVYEQEADRVADSVMRMPAVSAEQAVAPPPAVNPIQAKLAQQAHIRRAGTAVVPEVSESTESRIAQMRSGGSPLPKQEREFFEQRMGADFSGVRVHTDSNAIQTSRDLNARAFTVGNTIAFNSGEYQPGTEGGKRLLAHELTHTLQQGAVQRSAMPSLQRQTGTCPVCGKKGPVGEKCPDCGETFLPNIVQRTAVTAAPVQEPVAKTAVPEMGADKLEATQNSVLPQTTEKPNKAETTAPKGTNGTQKPTKPTALTRPKAEPIQPQEVAQEEPKAEPQSIPQPKADQPPIPLPNSAEVEATPNEVSAPEQGELAPAPMPQNEAGTSLRDVFQTPPTMTTQVDFAKLTPEDGLKMARELVAANQPQIELPTSEALVAEIETGKETTLTTPKLQIETPDQTLSPTATPATPQKMEGSATAVEATKTENQTPTTKTETAPITEPIPPTTGVGEKTNPVTETVVEAMPEKGAKTESPLAKPAKLEGIESTEIAPKVLSVNQTAPPSIQRGIVGDVVDAVMPDWVQGALDTLRGTADDGKSEVTAEGSTKQGELDAHATTKGTEVQTDGTTKGEAVTTDGTTKETEIETDKSTKQAELEADQAAKQTELEEGGVVKATELEEAKTTKEAELEADAETKRAELEADVETKGSELQSDAETKSGELEGYVDTVGQEAQVMGDELTSEAESQTATLETEATTASALVETSWQQLEQEATTLHQQLESQAADLCSSQQGQADEILSGLDPLVEDAQQQWEAFQSGVKQGWDQFMQNAQPMLDELGAKWDEFSSWVSEEVWAPLQKTIGEFTKWASEAMADAYAWLQEKWAWLTEQWGNAQEWLMGRADAARAWITEKADAAHEWITGQADAAREWISAKADAVREWITEKADAAREWMNERAEAANTWIMGKADAANEWITGKADAAREWINGKADAAVNWFRETGQGFVTNMSANARNVVSRVTSGGGPIMEWFGSIVNSLISGVESAGSTAVSVVSDAMSVGLNKVETFAKEATTFVETAGTGAVNLVSTAGTGAVNFLNNAGQTAVTFVENAGVDVVNTLESNATSAVNWLEGKGHAAVDTLASAGIAAVDTVEQWSKDAVEWLKNAWEEAKAGWEQFKTDAGDAAQWVWDEAKELGSAINEEIIQPASKWAGEQWEKAKSWVKETFPGLVACWELFQEFAGATFEKIKEFPIVGATIDAVGDIIEGALLGDLLENPNGWNILGQVIMGFIPYAGQAADVRDLIAALWKVSQGEGSWLDVTLALVAFIPGFGDAGKQADKLDEAVEVIEDIGKHVDDIPANYIDDVVEGLEGAEDATKGLGKFSDLGKIDPCFPPGTLVHTPNGLKRIETIKVGDFVTSYDFANQSILTAPVQEIYQNWTLNLVDINLGNETITATRTHPFWSVDKEQWVDAADLKKGMTLKLLGQGSVIIETVRQYAQTSDTYNLEIANTHNYFVGVSSILVHNGSGSSFESMDKQITYIYTVLDRNQNVVYVGKTTQSVEERMAQHLANKPDWVEKGYTSVGIDAGEWTRFDTAVWEQHYIEKYGGVGNLENKINAITEEKFLKYQSLHNPC